MLSVEEIIDLAKIKSINSYSKSYYPNIIKIVKEFVEQNKIVLDYTPDINFNITLYTSSPFKDANNLCNKLYTDGGFKYMILHTRLINKELNISINNEKLIFIKLLFIPNVIIYDRLELVKSKNNNILHKPLIIDILLETIDNSKLDNIIENIPLKTNYLEKIIDINVDSINLDNVNVNTYKYSINKELYNFIKGLNVIFLDYYYLYNTNYNKTIQIIATDCVITEIKNKLKTIIKKMDKDYSIIIQKDNTYIINEFRLNKTLIYLSFYDKKSKNINKINIVNVFNEVSYNIIPVLKSDNTIAHPYIILKYLVINLIYILIYLNKNHILYKENIKYIKLLLKKNINILDYKFIGVYKNEELDLNAIQVYRPVQYELNNEKLRII